MRAVRLLRDEGPAGLEVLEVPAPEPAPGEVLVRVHAAAITRDELTWPVDRLPATPSYELSGEADGEAVFGMTAFDRDGVAAEYAAVPQALLAPKPRSLSHVEAAALPLPGLTAWQGLFEHGRLEGGQTVLVLGAAGGVGSLAVQLARARGARVVAVASAGRLRGIEADQLVEYPSDGFEELVRGADLVFDTGGGERLRRALAALPEAGRLVSVAEEPPAREGASYFVVEPDREQLVQLARLADEGALRPQVSQVFPLAEARAAFERSLEAGVGKIVLRVL